MNKHFVFDSNKFVVESDFFESEYVKACDLPNLFLEELQDDLSILIPATPSKKKKAKKAVPVKSKKQKAPKVQYTELSIGLELGPTSLSKIKNNLNKKKSLITVKFLDGVNFENHRFTFEVEFLRMRIEKSLMVGPQGTPMEYWLDFKVISFS